jgi:hypothetical protein
VSQSDAKFLPQWLAIEERNLREARSDHERQTAQERLNRYRAMENQLKDQTQALELPVIASAAHQSVLPTPQNPVSVVSQPSSPIQQALPPVSQSDAKFLPSWIAMEERNLREARSERDRQTAQTKLNRYLAMEAQLKAQTQRQEGVTVHANHTTASVAP